MLKRIDVAEVQLGMFIHKLEGSWLKHPFWRTKFLLDDPQVLADLRASEVEGVLIDIEKGADVGDASSPAGRRRPLVPASSSADHVAERVRLERMQASQQAFRAASNVIPFDLRSATALSVAREVGHARAVVAKASRILSGVFEQARLGKALSKAQVEPVIEDLFASIQRNPHAFNGLMRIRRENSTLYSHGLAVSALMIALGRQMGLDEQRVKDAGMAGLLMDVGMGHLPIDVSTILDDLSSAQRNIVETHTTLGYEFLELGGELPEEVTRVCLEHHERYDGSGYPHGLVGEEIGLFGRMAAICDVYDSLTSDRPHRPRVDPNAALGLMRGMEGQFDEALLDQFIESVGVYPIGSVVRLTNGRLALVVDQNAQDYTSPRVWSFYDVGSRRVIKPEDLDLRFCRGRVEIVCSDDASDYAIENLPAIREMVFNSACKALA
ncbi:HD-GYP domain-containing protein [Sphingobium sp. SYK-6]|uniref:HD-GYP domain-containing protein n=1 Tax=Sphingobium sp. (strain NBRC 103272 / SYK-6) TaxID=627192 RepID=UPI000870B1DB|nr:HD-GYP domain-containing protein [Sphingobium sp. SYK-6]